MATINFDPSFNWSTIISIIGGIVAIVGFGWSIKANQKEYIAQSTAQYTALKTELDDIKGQVGELRRLQYEHGNAIKAVVKTAENNTKNIKTAVDVVKTVVADPNNNVSPQSQQTLNNKLRSIFIDIPKAEKKH